MISDPPPAADRGPLDGVATGSDPLALRATAERGLHEQEGILRDLRRAEDGERAFADGPFVLDSASACVSAYTEALARVQRRFWTTTLLSSGFWTHRTGSILAANREMAGRIRASGGQVRRVFLLDRPPESVVEEYRERRVFLDRMAKHDELARFDEELDSLIRNVRALASEGCEVRIVFDATRRSPDLPGAVSWAPDDSELAIYDDFRVDLFEGGRSGGIRRVTCLTSVMRSFEPCRDAAERFFADLWEKSVPVEGFLAHLEAAVAASRKKIHYRANWLARYEFALDEEDAAIKHAEARALMEALAARGAWGRIRSCLDVGTCTGRYPVLVAGGLAPGGRIVGIDDDPECVRFARSNVQRGSGSGSPIEIVLGDFLGTQELPHGPYDLVTCMMSTLSHFGGGRNGEGSDLLQAAIVRLAGHLAPDGVLILSTWSRAACEAGVLLSIYDESDTRRLARWTPGRPEMEARLARAGFDSVELVEPHPRLDLWICGKRSGSPG